ncbi:hypothetical protein OROHE_012324 [Orobanche hederae]
MVVFKIEGSVFRRSRLKNVESMESLLVRICIEAATESADAVEKWRRQRRTLERMPSHLDDALLRSLLGRRLLFPSLLDWIKIWLLAVGI